MKPDNGPGFSPSDSQGKKSGSPSMINGDGRVAGCGSKEQIQEKQSERVEDSC